MSPNGLGTLRMVSVLVKDKPHAVVSVLRIPVGESCADNFAHGTTGNLVAPIDPETGRLGSAMGSANTAWPVMQEVAVHPDTGVSIAGFEIPMWREAVECVKRVHQTFPRLRTVGWDIAITDDGPIVIEANHDYAVDALQVAMRRGLRSELTTLIESR